VFFGGLQAAENETPLSMILKTTIKKNKKSNFRPYGQMKQQRWEEPEKKSEKNRRKKNARKKYVFSMFCGSGGSKSRLAKAAGTGHGTIWSDERSKISRPCGTKQIWKKTWSKHLGFAALLEAEMWKNCMPLWHEGHLKPNCTKHLSSGSLLAVAMSKKSTPLWPHFDFQSKMLITKHHMFGPLLGV